MLLCNRMPAPVYDGLVTEGTNAAMWESADDLEKTVLHYLAHEDERQALVANAQLHVMRHPVESYSVRTTT